MGTNGILECTFLSKSAHRTAAFENRKPKVASTLIAPSGEMFLRLGSLRARSEATTADASVSTAIAMMVPASNASSAFSGVMAGC